MLNYNKMTNEKYVLKQYSDDSALKIRKQFHKNFSVKKQGYGPWLFSQYEFSDGMKVLELGSGNGDLWELASSSLFGEIELTLSDYSDGMIEILNEKYSDTGINIMKIDIQDIPFEEDSFDMIIANAMLYHVPDIDKAVSEVFRTLKPGGRFYSTTFGENGLSSFINECFIESGIKINGTENISFTLQNGAATLRKKFKQVSRVDFNDKLLISDVNDLLDYIFSMTLTKDLSDEDKNSLINYMLTIKGNNEYIEIPKEYGNFVSIK